MLVPIAFILAFVAVVVIVQSVAGLAFASSDRGRRVNRRLSLMSQGLSQDEVYATLVRKPEGGRLAAAAPGLHERLFNYCRQAGLTMSPERLALIVAASAVLIWVIALVLLNALSGKGVIVNALVSLVGATGLAVGGAYMWLDSRRTARHRLLESQMPLALDIVVRAIRAGHPVVSAVQLAADEMSDPIGSEFGLIVDETTYGLEFREALLNFARRTGSQDAHYFAVSVGIQSETGGNLAEILQNLSAVIRDRQSLHLKVRALASEGRMSALVLSVLPLIVIAFLLLTQPAFYLAKFADPIFWPSVAGIVVLYFIGQLIMGRIVNFKY